MTVFASDDFNGTEDTELSAYSASWTLMTGVTPEAQIASSRVRNSATSLSSYRNTATPPSADYPVAASLYVADAASNRRAGVTGRASSSANSYYLARLVTGTGWQLVKVTNGSTTQLDGNVAQTVSEGVSYDVKLNMSGTTIELYKLGEGTPAISVTDSAFSDAGFAGLYFNSGIASDTAGVHIDDWSAGEAAAGTTIDCTAGAIDFTGGDATLDETLDSAPGEIDFAGVQASLVETVAATAGEIDFAGGAATLDEEIGTAAGGVDFAGVQASVEVAGATEINCTAGEVAFTGVQSTLLETVFTNTSAVAFQGGTVGFTITLDTVAGAITFEGAQGTVFAPVIVDCTASQIAFTGVSASVAAGGGPRGRARGRRRHYGTLGPSVDHPEVQYAPQPLLRESERFIPLAELVREVTPALSLPPADKSAAKKARNLHVLAEILKHT